MTPETISLNCPHCLGAPTPEQVASGIPINCEYCRSSYAVNRSPGITNSSEPTPQRPSQATDKTLDTTETRQGKSSLHPEVLGCLSVIPLFAVVCGLTVDLLQLNRETATPTPFPSNNPSNIDENTYILATREPILTPETTPNKRAEFVVPFFDCPSPDKRYVSIGYWDLDGVSHEFMRASYNRHEQVTKWHSPNSTSLPSATEVSAYHMVGWCHTNEGTIVAGFYFQYQNPEEVPIPHPGDIVVFDPNFSDTE